MLERGYWLCSLRSSGRKLRKIRVREIQQYVYSKTLWITGFYYIHPVCTKLSNLCRIHDDTRAETLWVAALWLQQVLDASDLVLKPGIQSERRGSSEGWHRFETADGCERLLYTYYMYNIGMRNSEENSHLKLQAVYVFCITINA